VRAASVNRLTAMGPAPEGAPNNLVPIAVLPTMLIAVSGLQSHGSTDGVNFQPRGLLPYPLR
jgi:hypothetical protein